MRKIVLASASSRRKELLEKIGLRVEVDPPEYVEDLSLDLAPHELVKKLSLEKAHIVAARHRDAIIIAADTIGVLERQIIGKPQNEAEAKEMLGRLSGRAHLVITGFTIIDTTKSKVLTKSVETKVYFRRLTTCEIDAYVRSGEPLGKAGGYAIQGRGALLVDKIEGDFYNVVGLSLSALGEGLRTFGVDLMIPSPLRGGGKSLPRTDTGVKVKNDCTPSEVLDSPWR